MEIRAPRRDEADAVHSLAMLGLRDTPEAFSSTYEENLALTPEEIGTRYLPRESHLTLCAFLDGAPVGTVGLSVNSRLKTRHNASLSGMFVDPAFRRRGIGKALLDAAIAEARKRPHLEQITLCVTVTCAPAVALYESAGFQRFGIEPEALKQNGESFDIAFMKLFLEG
jgi:ribosomal protein S18 acetylase RimI-like enzyme